MNAAKITTLVVPTQEIAPTVNQSPEFLSMPAAVTNRGTRLRHLLLLGIAVLTAWIAITTLSSIMEINAHMDAINQNLSVPIFARG